MVVTILYRLSGEPVIFGAMPFSDVTTVAEYAETFGLDHESQAELNTYGDFEEYKILLSGSVDVESNLAAMNEKLELAGVDAICAELQTQVDAFLGK